MPDSRLLFLDFEGTGTDPYTDRIVEACFIRPGGQPWTTRVNPGIPIPAAATAIHGITDEDVAGAPTFAQLAPRIQAAVDGVILVGYNIRRYDTVLLDAELQRAGQPGLERDDRGRICIGEIDLYQVWMRSEPRTLAGAAARFAGVELGADAHSARADTVVLPEVLDGLCRSFGLDVHDTDALCSLSAPPECVDRDGKFLRREDGIIVFNFSQQKGTPVQHDAGLLEWMLRRDFSEETKAFAREFIDEIYAGVI